MKLLYHKPSSNWIWFWQEQCLLKQSGFKDPQGDIPGEKSNYVSRGTYILFSHENFEVICPD